MDYLIENDVLRVTVTTYGGQIKSVIRKNDGVEHIWQADPTLWGFHGPVLFPYTGKVKDGRIDIRGKRVENAQIHGFVRTAEHRLLEQGSDYLCFSVEENEKTLEIFPYHFQLISRFSLDSDRLCHRLTVVNTDVEPFSFGIGYHPGFAIPFDDHHSIEDYELRFSEMESPICLDTPEGLPNGKYYTLGTNIRTIAVTDGMFDVGSHCMVNLRSQTLGLYEKGSDRAVICNIAQYPYCLLWSTPGKPRFICIEPWHSLPSFENGGHAWNDKPAAAILAPREQWSTVLEMRFAG